MTRERVSERNFPRMPRFRDDYWLCHCEGYWVEQAGRRLGVVENVVFESELDRPGALRIRSGLFREKLQVVRVDQVAEIVPREGLLRLRPEPEQATTRRARGRIGGCLDAVLRKLSGTGRSDHRSD
jgi:hypothetical protein